MKRLENELELANQQILALSEIVTLDPKEQASRLKEVEKLPLKAENLMRIKTLRNNIESLPNTPNRQSVTQYGRFVDSEFTNFSLSPEILSEKLYDSVKMIRDLMNSNKKLKENISELNQQRKVIEVENIQLHNENQDLVEKLENYEARVIKTSEKNESKELIKIKKEREKLLRKIEALEDEKRKEEQPSGKGDWSWKSKRTILRNHRHSQDSKNLPAVTADRGRFQKKSEAEAGSIKVYRPLSQDFAMDSTKQEAIATLSKILMNGIPY